MTSEINRSFRKSVHARILNLKKTKTEFPQPFFLASSLTSGIQKHMGSLKNGSYFQSAHFVDKWNTICCSKNHEKCSLNRWNKIGGKKGYNQSRQVCWSYLFIFCETDLCSAPRSLVFLQSVLSAKHPSCIVSFFLCLMKQTHFISNFQNSKNICTSQFLTSSHPLSIFKRNFSKKPSFPLFRLIPRKPLQFHHLSGTGNATQLI